MNKIYAALFTVLAAPALTINICHAQSATLNLKPAPANITIDGNATEWGDSLAYYNPETKLNYTLANDKDNLYLVIKTNNPVLQAQILTAGVTFSVDTKGRKKSSNSLTYPILSAGQIFTANSSLEEKRMAIGISKLRKIKMEGFKDIEDDEVTLQNTYGFRMALNFDDQGTLIYEEQIPLAMLHADDAKKVEWMFNIKVAGFQKSEQPVSGNDDVPMGGSGRGSRGGGGGGRGGAGGGGGFGGGGGRNGGFGGGGRSGERQNAKSTVDFWGKLNLAKAQ